MDMSPFIYVLLLSIWINIFFDINQTNVSSTTGAKLQSMETKMDSFRRHLFIIIIGFMIISFVFTCFCFLRYNCKSEDALKGVGMTKNQEQVANSSKSLSETKTTSLCSPCSPEKQPLLPSVDKLYGLPRPKKSPILSSTKKLIRQTSTEKSSKPSSTEKLIRTPSPEKSSIPSSTEKLIKPSNPKKPSLPSSAEKLTRTPSPEKSSIPSSTKKLIKPSNPKKPSLPSSAEKLIRPSSPEKVFRSEMSSRSTNREKKYKLASQVSSPYSHKPVRPPWQANPQYPARPAKPPCVPSPQNKKFPPKSSSPEKLPKPPRHPHPKRRGNRNRTVMPRSRQLIKTCPRYGERCLVCNTSDETLVGNIAEPKVQIAQTPPSSREVKSYSRSCRKTVSMDKEYYVSNYVSDSDLMTCDSDDDSDREITIICNRRRNYLLPVGIQDN
ncbi:uncharacterized protein CXorf66 homolog [Tamandua tetradactyla]|uniref:uncharacterized protein CXorf66 homolog n=1 Tax=Tamandua tetradactyla TaxID=48850 RepID=UPI004054165F